MNSIRDEIKSCKNKISYFEWAINQEKNLYAKRREEYMTLTSNPNWMEDSFSRVKVHMTLEWLIGYPERVNKMRDNIAFYKKQIKDLKLELNRVYGDSSREFDIIAIITVIERDGFIGGSML